MWLLRPVPVLVPGGKGCLLYTSGKRQGIPGRARNPAQYFLAGAARRTLFYSGGQRRRKANAGQGADGVCVAALRSQGAGSGQDLRAREPAGIAQDVYKRQIPYAGNR